MDLNQIDLFRQSRVLEFKELAKVAAKNPKWLKPIGVAELKKKQKNKKRAPKAVSEEAKAARLAIAREIYEQGGSISALARRVGIHSSSASQWLRGADPELHRMICDQSHPVMLNKSARIARLMVIKIGMEMGLTINAIARELSMRPEALLVWRNRWAPDGIDDALECELGEYEEAA